MAASTTSYNPSYRYGDSKPKQLLIPAGTKINIGDICFASGPTRTVTDGATTISTATLTSATALFTAGDVGATVAATGIPGGTTILSVQSSTSVTMSANATATGSSLSLTITPTQGPSVYPAMSFPWTTNLVTTQQNFVKSFCGVAAEGYDGSAFVNGVPTAYGIQDGNLRVNSGGVFDFVCASATWGVGDLVAPDQDGANNNLFAQRVISVNANGVAAAIGRVVQPYTVATTTVRVEIFAPVLSLVNAGTI